MRLRKFQIELSGFFQGYNKFIDVERFNNINDIIHDVLNDCEQFLKIII